MLLDALTLPTLALSHGVAAFLMFLPWAALALLNFWIWSKTKAQGNMLMMIGAGVTALLMLIMLVDSSAASSLMIFWLPLFALITFVAGFYMSVKPMVEAQIAELKAKAGKLKDKASDAVSGDDDNASA